jgi:crotonobetainyl-CoA:carnitine CoA-transferase CaiB-like acyl-CoA transferase
VQSLLSRTENSEILYREVGETLAQGTMQHWLTLFAKYDIPAAPVHTLETAIYDQHLTDVGFFRTVEHPTEGQVRQMATPGTWSGGSLPEPTPAPALGQHTAEVLREFGVDDDLVRRVAGE